MKFGIKKIEFRLEKIKNLPWVLGSHAFLIMLFLILATLLIGGFLSYQYVTLIETNQQNAVEKNVKFEYTMYKEVTDKWQVKDQNLKASEAEQYINPFIAPLPSPNPATSVQPRH